MRIQHNIAAMSSYRNYTNNVSAVNKNLEKLSSGYKINRAGDDAAGLAISEKMRAQISGLETAQKNAKDGISLVKTAEGALQEVHDMLNRMVTLATQSANGTYDNETDREQLQKELDQLRSEIDRIADSSNFNGIKLLDGSMDSSFKVSGAADAEIEIVADGQMGIEPQAGVYSIDFSNTTVTSGGAGSKVNLNVFGKDLEITLSTTAGDELSGADLANEFAAKWTNNYSINWKTSHGIENIDVSVQGDKLVFTMSNAPTKAWDQSALTGSLTYTNSSGNNGEEVSVTAETPAVDTTMSRMYGQAKLALDDTIVKDGGTLTIGDETYVFAVGASSKYKNIQGGKVIDLTDKTAASDDLIRTAAERLTKAAEGNAQFKVGTDRNKPGDATIYFTEKEGGVDYAKNNLAGEDGKGTKGNGAATGKIDATEEDWAGLIQTGSVDASTISNGLTLQIGDTADPYNQLKVSIGNCHVAAIGIGDISIADQASAAKAVDAIKNAINYVSDVRGTLGATQNRLDHTINNLSVMTENIQDAESTIRDTDIAEEMMSYTKNNILVQSAQAMLAQANQIPQGVLQLLG